MPNYTLTSGSTFKPFTFEELLKPALMATQAHRELEDAYSELSDKASIWDGMTIGSEGAHNTYLNYASDLDRLASELSKNGLNPGSRSDMLKMKSRYNKEIIPIEQAYKTRNAQIEAQMKAGDSMINEFEAKNKSLDDYIRNPSLAYSSINRDNLYKRSLTDFGHLANELTKYGKGEKIDEFTNSFIKQYGITREQAAEFINQVRSGRISESNPVLSSIYSNLYDSTGVNTWDNAQAKNLVRDTILEGALAGIGKSDVSIMANKQAELAAQLEYQKALYRFQAGETEKERMKAYDIGPSKLYSASEIAAENNKLVKELDKWKDKGYFDKNGNLTTLGKKVLEDTEFMNKRKSPYAVKGRSGDIYFYNWAKDKGDVSTYYKDIMSKVASGELATGDVNVDVYKQKIHSQADKNGIADQIFAIIGEDNKIYEVGALKGDKLSEREGLKADDFAKVVGRDNKGKGDANIVSIISSPSTNADSARGIYGQMLIELSNGKKYLLPKGVLTDDYSATFSESSRRVQQAASNAERLVELNRMNAAYASILNTITGTANKINDGTYNYYTRQ